MKNMVWHGQAETVIRTVKTSYCDDVLHVYPDAYGMGSLTLSNGQGDLNIHIDELREIIQRYDARI